MTTILSFLFCKNNPRIITLHFEVNPTINVPTSLATQQCTLPQPVGVGETKEVPLCGPKLGYLGKPKVVIVSRPNVSGLISEVLSIGNTTSA